jgi:hypothetical protein
MVPEPRAEVDIRGTLVGFLRRDVRQISDQERKHVEGLVESLRREAGSDRAVVRLVIETDYPDPDRLAYTASYRVDVRGCADGAGEGEGDDRRDPQ